MSCICQQFCGCELYCEVSSNGNMSQQQAQIKLRVYVSIFLMLALTSVSLRLGTQWFIFKDYFPLKERSPMICILAITFITLQLMLYPLIYTFSYFMNNYDESKSIYKVLYYGLDGSIYLTYVFRSLRLVYAHEIDSSRSNTKIYQYFKKEYLLALTILAILFLKVLPIIFNDQNTNFYMAIQFRNQYRSDDEIGYLVLSSIHEFIWLSLLTYCLWLQTFVHDRYSMKLQLVSVIGLSLISSTISIVLISTEIQQNSMLLSLCIQDQGYPIWQIIRDINFVGLYLISVIYPLFKKKIEHKLLPVGRVYDLAKTMSDFLLEQQFMDIFRNFLQNQNLIKSTTTYTDALDYWKKLMLIKYNAHGNEAKLIEDVKNLIQNIEDKPVKEIHSNLIINLKKSIISFEESDSIGSIDDRQRFREEITEKIEELESLFLQKLDMIYKQQYRTTKSYHYLRRNLIKNKKINVNMITLNLAVMIESDDYHL